jgi:hypothetical protein
MRELVATARGRGAGRLVAWGGVAVVAFTAAFASWQYSPVRNVSGDTALATASIPTPAVTTTGGATTPPTARQVGRGITNVPGVSDLSLVQRDLADLRQDLADLRRGLSRYDVANEQTGRRLEALEDQAAILASRLAQALDGPRPLPPGTPAASLPPAPQAAAPAPMPPAKPGMAKLEPALFDNRIGKVAPRPLVPEAAAETKVAETVKTVEAKPIETKPIETKAVEAKAPEPKPAPAREAKVAADAEPEAAVTDPAPTVAKPAAKDAPSAKPAEPVVATAPVPVPPPSTPPINATVRPPSPAEEAQRAQRAAQAAQVQQLAQQMILAQPGGKGLQLPLPANAQLAAAAAAAKAEAKRDAAPEATGTVPTADDAAATKTAFAVDLGGYKSLANLRKGWATTSSKHAGLTKGLTPLGQMKESGGAVEARLVAGPFANAADAVKFCAQVQSAGTACAPSVYVGQPLNP